MSANDKQVGGTHYKNESGLQHWDLVYMIFGGDYLLGYASKYMARLGKKGGLEKDLEDLEKAIHCLEKKREMIYAELTKSQPEPKSLPRGDLRFSKPEEL